MARKKKTLEELRREKAALPGPPLADRSLQSLRNRKAELPGPPPLAGGLDSVAGDNGLGPPGSAARVAKAKAALGKARGVPRRLPNETEQQMVDRLVGTGRSSEEAGRLAQARTGLDEATQQRLADRDQRRAAHDARRRAKGLPTRDERSRETQRRIALRRGGQSLLDDINRRRIAQGRKPFGPVVREGPIQIQSLDEVDPSIHGSGQNFVTPDGEMFRFIITPGGQQIHVPLTSDPRTGQPVIDTRQVNINEFTEALTNNERQNRIRSVLDSGTIFARDLQGILNNMAGLGQAVRDGTSSEATKQEQIEKLQDDLDELLFDFADKIGFVPESERQRDARIEQEEDEADIAEKQRVEQARVVEKRRAEKEARAKERRATIGKLVDNVTKELTDQAQAALDDKPGGGKAEVPLEEIKAEVRRRLEVIDSLTGKTEESSLEEIRPPRQGTSITEGDANKIRDHVLKFHPDLDLAEQRRKAAEIAQEVGFIAG